MIFFTLGTHQPFDRLVRLVDDWCARNPDAELQGQLPAVAGGGYRPANFPWVTRLHPSDYSRLIQQSRFVVAHAGMGSIITALCLSTPIVIFPRRAALREQRNDHQIATAARFANYHGVTAALTEDELVAALDRHHAAPGDALATSLGPFADPRLTDALRRTILAAATRRPRTAGVAHHPSPLDGKDRGLSGG